MYIIYIIYIIYIYIYVCMYVCMYLFVVYRKRCVTTKTKKIALVVRKRIIKVVQRVFVVGMSFVFVMTVIPRLVSFI